MLRQRRQADYLKPSFLLAPNRSADDQCQECPEGITRDARSAPLTVIVRGSRLRRREGCHASSACRAEPGLWYMGDPVGLLAPDRADAAVARRA